jgi:hypothetical protein
MVTKGYRKGVYERVTFKTVVRNEETTLHKTIIVMRGRPVRRKAKTEGLALATVA